MAYASPACINYSPDGDVWSRTHNDGSASSPTEIISFIEDEDTIKKILKHCGKWKEAIPRPPPQISAEPTFVAEDVILDYDFTFDKLSLIFACWITQ